MGDFDSLRNMVVKRIERQEAELAESRKQLAGIDALTGRDRQVDLVAAAAPPAPPKK